MLTRLAIVALVIGTGFSVRIAYEYTTLPAQAQERDPTSERKQKGSPWGERLLLEWRLSELL